MERNYSNVDVNAMPVHLFVKSPKQAKKIEKYIELYHVEHVIYKKGKMYKSPILNYA